MLKISAFLVLLSDTQTRMSPTRLTTSRLRVIKYGISWLKDATSVVNPYVLPHMQQSLTNSLQS